MLNRQGCERRAERGLAESGGCGGPRGNKHRRVRDPEADGARQLWGTSRAGSSGSSSTRMSRARGARWCRRYVTVGR